MTFSQRVSNKQITKQPIDQINEVIYRLFLSKNISSQSFTIMLIPYVAAQVFPLGAMYVKKKNSTYEVLKFKAVCTKCTTWAIEYLEHSTSKKSASNFQMLNFFIRNSWKTVPIFTFFLENSCRSSFSHTVKSSSATAALRHLSVDYIIIRFFARHSTAATRHYLYRFFKTFTDSVFCSWKFCYFVLK